MSKNKKVKVKRLSLTATRKLTCQKSSIDHRDYLLNLTPDSQVLEAVAAVDLRTSCPSIYDQGQLGSCVANGIGFNMQFDQIKLNMAHQFIPSRLFIYYNTRVIENSVNEDSGTTIRDALTSVATSGACPETLWPYLIGQFATRPSAEAYASGKKHLAGTYARVLMDLAQMKQCLIDGYPFIFGILLYSSFERVSGTGLVPVPKAGESLLGGHCMAVVGYDDTRQVFIVRNSWGTDWGDKGYCYMPYSYMTNSNTTFDLWTIRSVTDTEVTFANIKTVTYGKGGVVADVTNIFVNYFSAGNTQLQVENSIFGDPIVGVVKELRITFNNNAVLVYNEHAIVTASQLTNQNNNITTVNNIISAMYGKNNTYIDVTNIVKNLFSQGYSQITASNTLFTDPLVGIFKELRLTLVGGVLKVFPENGIITLNDISDTSGGPAVAAANINTAVYGKNTRYLDVTTILKNQFSGGAMSVRVSNSLFTDPIYGVVKELRVTLVTGTTKIFVENSYVRVNDLL